MSKKLAGKGLKVHALHGHTELLAAFRTICAPEAATANSMRTPFAPCAMEMGTLKECDVLLTYAEHMEACHICVSQHLFHKRPQDWAAADLDEDIFSAAMRCKKEQLDRRFKQILCGMQGYTAEDV